jgi:hypothetical protein
LGSCGAVNPSFYRDKVAVFEFLCADFHNFSSGQGFMLLIWKIISRPTNEIAWKGFDAREVDRIKS